MRFDLVDQVLERSSDRVVTLKAVTTAEEYLGDHFPGFPVLPGVMMLEALVQAGRVLIAEHDKSGQPWVVRQVRNVRYGNMVRPGQCLKVEVTLKKQTDDGYDLTGVGQVDEQVAVQGRFTLCPADGFDQGSQADT